MKIRGHCSLHKLKNKTTYYRKNTCRDAVLVLCGSVKFYSGSGSYR